MVMSQGPGAWWENRRGRRAGSVRMRSRLWKSEGLEFGDLEGLMWNRGTFCTRPGLFPQVYKPSCLFLIWSQIFWSLSVKFELRLRLLSLVRPSVMLLVDVCAGLLLSWVPIQLHRSLLRLFLALETHLHPYLMETSKVRLTFDPTSTGSPKPDKYVWLASLTLGKVRTTQRKRNLTSQI